MDDCHYIRTRPADQLSLFQTDALYFLSSEKYQMVKQVLKKKKITRKNKNMNPETESVQWQAEDS